MTLNQGQLEAATNALVQGCSHLANEGMSLDIIVNALIGAMITVCHAAHEDPRELARSFRKCAELIPGMYEMQDKKLKSRAN